MIYKNMSYQCTQTNSFVNCYSVKNIRDLMSSASHFKPSIRPSPVTAEQAETSQCLLVIVLSSSISPISFGVIAPEISCLLQKTKSVAPASFYNLMCYYYFLSHQLMQFSLAI